MSRPFQPSTEAIAPTVAELQGPLQVEGAEKVREKAFLFTVLPSGTQEAADHACRPVG